MEELNKLDDLLRQKNLNGYDGLAILSLMTGSFIGLVVAGAFMYLSWRSK